MHIKSEMFQGIQIFIHPYKDKFILNLNSKTELILYVKYHLNFNI